MHTNTDNTPASIIPEDEKLWRQNNPDAAKWFDAYKECNKQWIELAEGAVLIKKQNEKLKASHALLLEALKDLAGDCETPLQTIIEPSRIFLDKAKAAIAAAEKQD